MHISSGRRWRLLLVGLLVFTLWGQVAAAVTALTPRAYLPLVEKPLVEARALWVTRFDWTSSGQPAQPAKIDEIVNKAAAANFNMLLFQVRGTADAYYAPGLEPWAQRVSGEELGDPPDPFWDPLAYMVTSARAAGLQVHAYLNVYPTWSGTEAPKEGVVPEHPFWTWSHWPDTDWADWRHWYWDCEHGEPVPMPLSSGYLFASPAAPMVADHIANVAKDIVSRYTVNGVHLDNIRYAGPQYSCDPFTIQYSPSLCCTSGWQDWQRGQISALVQRIYRELPPRVMLSAAVWPSYEIGYRDYYQDSKAWVQGGYIDSILPMIYTGTQADWQTRVADFQNDSAGRFIIPGMWANYSDFDEISNRIDSARALGTAGHAIFSYSLIDDNEDWDWDAFTAPGGPHEEPAAVPTMSWR